MQRIVLRGTKGATNTTTKTETNNTTKAETTNTNNGTTNNKETNNKETNSGTTNKQQFLKGNSLSKLPPFLLHFISIIDKPSLYPQSPLHTIIYCSFSLPIPSDFLPLTVP